MGRYHFGKRAFAFNRWSVGSDASDGSVAVKQTAWDIRKGEKRARKYKQSREKAKVRPVLMRIDPHCQHCRLRLQDCDPSGPNYACVVANRLACPGCVRAVRLSDSTETPIDSEAKGGGL